VLIDRIRATSDDTALPALVAELQRAVHDHMEEEETEILPRARDELPAEELEELGERFEEAKDEQQ
jgi:hypothetical protein